MVKLADQSYTLYLDESKMRIGNKGEDAYCVAGIIIQSVQMQQIRKRLKQLKQEIWEAPDDFVPAPPFRSIHQAEVRNPSSKNIDRHPYMQVFRSRSNQNKAITGIGRIIKDFELPVLGAIVNEKRLQDDYGAHQDSYTAYYTSLRVIVEDFSHFLVNHQSHGKIVLESRANSKGDLSDQRVRKTFYKIMSHGTIRYSAIELQRLIYGIGFSPKTQNDAGIQIADYIPRAFLYHYCEMVQPKPSIYQIIRRQRYDGGDKQLFDRYRRHGIHVVD